MDLLVKYIKHFGEKLGPEIMNALPTIEEQRDYIQKWIKGPTGPADERSAKGVLEGYLEYYRTMARPETPLYVVIRPRGKHSSTVGCCGAGDLAGVLTEEPTPIVYDLTGKRIREAKASDGI